MTPDERAAERFARETQRRSKKGSLFNLEEDEDGLELTHLGRSLTFDEGAGERESDGTKDDFEGLDEEDTSEDEYQTTKRRRLSPPAGAEEGGEDAQELSGRPKTKNEVMKEVMAKSKLHKYERQKAREDDDDLRAELDGGLAEIYDLIRGRKPAAPQLPLEDAPPIQMNPDRAALLNGKDRAQADREYDERLRQMAFDKRSRPADRTKTEEEKAQEEAERLKNLEADRLRRMLGEHESDSEADQGPDQLDLDQESVHDDAEEFGLTLPNGNSPLELAVEDEDDFILDDDLVASDPDTEAPLSDDGSLLDEQSAGEDDDAEFLSGLTLSNGGRDLESNSQSVFRSGSDNGVAYTYPCPKSHHELLEIMEKAAVEDLPTIVQRIRALYHPKLSSDNKPKMEAFCAVLVEHVAYLANQPSKPPFEVLENLLRHIHSLAKSYPESVGRAFRTHLKEVGEDRPLNLLPGDLIILTGVSTTFPTSDHFHQVVTPSMLTITRYLGQSVVHSLGDLATGAYLCSLCLQYQSISRRFVPEFMNYVLNALDVLAPVKPQRRFGHAPHRQPAQSVRMVEVVRTTRALKFWDVIPEEESSKDNEVLKAALVENFTRLVAASGDLWEGKSASYEIFAPAKGILQHYLNNSCVDNLPESLRQCLRSVLKKINTLLAQAKLRRRPLLLHNHRPLAIKTSIPKFEESFNPDRHYDPDRERAELSKLKAEHKRERKGAMRELRKDANFIARESLKEKKATDAEYERKQRRLIAEINAEEGREANNYAREKMLRKRKR
jgi:nucleolar protein 14